MNQSKDNGKEFNICQLKPKSSTTQKGITTFPNKANSSRNILTEDLKLEEKKTSLMEDKLEEVPIFQEEDTNNLDIELENKLWPTLPLNPKFNILPLTMLLEANL